MRSFADTLVCISHIWDEKDYDYETRLKEYLSNLAVQCFFVGVRKPIGCTAFTTICANREIDIAVHTASKWNTTSVLWNGDLRGV